MKHLSRNNQWAVLWCEEKKFCSRFFLEGVPLLFVKCDRKQLKSSRSLLTAFAFFGGGLWTGAGANTSGRCFAPSGWRVSRRSWRSASSLTPSTDPSSSSSTRTPLTFRLRMLSVSNHVQQSNTDVASLWTLISMNYVCVGGGLQACWTWPPLTVKAGWSNCVSRSSRGESLWRTPSPCCLPPYDTTQRCGTGRHNLSPPPPSCVLIC